MSATSRVSAGPNEALRRPPPHASSLGLGKVALRWLFSFACISRLLGTILLLAGMASAYDTLDTSGGLATVPGLNDGDIIGQGDDIQLSPHDWVGRRFPLARHVDIGPALMKGRWALMFYHANCSTCRTTLPEFVGLAYHLANQDRATRVALIEVPRQGDSPPVRSREGLCWRGRLLGERRWRIGTPAFVVLDSGMVTKVPDQLNDVYRELGVDAGAEEQGGMLFPDFRRIR